MKRTETTCIEDIKKRIHYMTDHVWNGITNTDVEEFINNFHEDDKVVGWILLDMLIYYSSEQEGSIILNLIRLLERDIWINNKEIEQGASSKCIEDRFDNLYRKMCFVPVDESDASASSFNLTGQFKKSKGVSDKIKYVKLIDFPLMIAMQYKYFVFYDDIIGTGKQFVNFWRKQQFGDSKKFSLEKLAEKNPDKHFYYLVLGGCREGVEHIKQEIPNIRVIVSEFFEENVSVLDDKNEYWELNPHIKERVIEYIHKIEIAMQFREYFCKYIPVLFQHGRASNTALSLYWNGKDGLWKELYKR